MVRALIYSLFIAIAFTTCMAYLPANTQSKEINTVEIVKHFTTFTFWFLLTMVITTGPFLMRKFIFLFKPKRALPKNDPINEDSNSEELSNKTSDCELNTNPASEKKGKSKKYLPVLIIMVVLVIISLARENAQQSPANSTKEIPDDSNYLNVLSAISNEVNKNLPMVVDRSTRCDSVSPGEQKLIVNFTITNEDMYEIPPELMRNSGFEMTKNSLCTDPDFSKVLNMGLGIELKYRKNDGSFLFSFTVMPSDCN